jgi:hypothetical protein
VILAEGCENASVFADILVPQLRIGLDKLLQHPNAAMGFNSEWLGMLGIGQVEEL